MASSRNKSFSPSLKNPSQIPMIVLSVIMILSALAGLIPHHHSVSKEPFLTTWRDQTQNGHFFSQHRVEKSPFLYRDLHIIPAIIWSILIPTQHLSFIRKNYLQFHRFSGWLIAISALSLSISGSIFPLFDLSYSHPDLFHVHKLPIPIGTSSSLYLPFPTFNLQLKVLPIIILFPLYKAIQAIRVEKNVQKHRFWMILHTIGGYSISLQRVGMVFNATIGWTISSLPEEAKEFVYRSFNAPDEKDLIQRWEIERSAFALTMGFGLFAAWRWSVSLKNKDKKQDGKSGS